MPDAMKEADARKQQEAVSKIMATHKVNFEEALDIYIKRTCVAPKQSG